MIIHTSVAPETIALAAQRARVRFDRYHQRGSRTHARAYNVTLFGESARLPNGGRSGAYRYGQDNDHAATWDQWGVFLAAIFDADPHAKMTYYRDREDFREQTTLRFDDGWPEDAHGDHAWEYRAPYTQGCKRCSAVKVWRDPRG